MKGDSKTHKGRWQDDGFHQDSVDMAMLIVTPWSAGKNDGGPSNQRRVGASPRLGGGWAVALGLSVPIPTAVIRIPTKVPQDA